MQGCEHPRCDRPTLLLFAADHGVTDEGVSAYAKDATAKMVYQYLAGGAVVNAFARQHGKKLSIPEWGIGGPSIVRNCSEPGIDNPFFMRKMFAFFRANAGSIAYEAYFNGHGGATDTNGTHKLFSPSPNYPSTDAPGYLDYVQRYNPLSAEAYRRFWTGGSELGDLYWLRYAASANDTVTSIGADPARAQAHYETTGQAQGREVLFDPWSYMSRNPDLASILQNDPLAATRHYLTTGWREGRTFSADKVRWLSYAASYKGLLDGMPEAQATEATIGLMYRAYYADMGGHGTPPDILSQPKEPVTDNVTAFRRPAPQKPKNKTGPNGRTRLPVALIFMCLVVVYVGFRYLWR